MFCSKRCRDEAVKLYHRVECEMMPTLLAQHSGPERSPLETSELLALRILLIVTQQGKEFKRLMTHPIYKQIFSDKKYVHLDKKFMSEDYFNIHNLEDHYEKRTLLHWFPLITSTITLLNGLINSSFFDENEKMKNQVNFKDTKSFHSLHLSPLPSWDMVL